MRRLFPKKFLASPRTRRARWIRWSAFILSGTAALLFLASLSGSVGTGFHTAEIADCARRVTPAEQALCLAPVSREAVRSGKTEAMLRTLEKLVRSETLDDCHHLAHALGHASFEARENLIRAMREGDASCHKGYYHGVVEAAVHHAASLGKRDIATLCTDLHEEALAYDGCLHGLGHGLMHLSDNSVTAQAPCDSLPDVYARQRCVDGVLMENAMQYLNLDEAHYRVAAPQGCDRFPLPSGQRGPCHEAIGEIAMFYYRHNLSAALEICRAVGEPSGQGGCERGAREELRAWQQERQERSGSRF